MGDVVNLNRFRKAKVKAEKVRQTEANRAKFGRTKAEKCAAKTLAEKLTGDLDGKKLED